MIPLLSDAHARMVPDFYRPVAADLVGSDLPRSDVAPTVNGGGHEDARKRASVRIGIHLGGRDRYRPHYARVHPGTGCLRQRSCLRIVNSTAAAIMQCARLKHKVLDPGDYSSSRPRVLRPSTGMPGPMVVVSVMDLR